MLELIDQPDRALWRNGPRGRDFTEDGVWFRLWRIPNVGKVTITELVSKGSIEPDDDNYGFRFRIPPGNEARRTQEARMTDKIPSLDGLTSWHVGLREGEVQRDLADDDDDLPGKFFVKLFFDNPEQVKAWFDFLLAAEKR